MAQRFVGQVSKTLTATGKSTAGMTTSAVAAYCVCDCRRIKTASKMHRKNNSLNQNIIVNWQAGA
jgi:hypothetical protein